MLEQSGFLRSNRSEDGDGSSRPASFPTTNWSDIGKLAATDPDEARRAFDAWLRRYWRPLRAFFRSQGYQSHDANDLTQTLVLHLYEKEKFKQLEPHTHLRYWLLTIAKNWLRDDYRSKHAAVRCPEEGLVLLSQIANSTDVELPIIDPHDPEAAYNSSWRLEVLSAAYQSTQAECSRQNRLRDFELFARYYIVPQEAAHREETVEKPTWSELAVEYGLESARVAASRSDWVKRVFRDCVLAEIRRYVICDYEVADELKKLLSGDVQT